MFASNLILSYRESLPPLLPLHVLMCPQYSSVLSSHNIGRLSVLICFPRLAPRCTNGVLTKKHNLGRELWSSGYGRRLMFEKLSHWFVVKIVLFVWKDQNKQKRDRGWSICFLKNAWPVVLKVSDQKCLTCFEQLDIVPQLLCAVAATTFLEEFLLGGIENKF